MTDVQSLLIEWIEQQIKLKDDDIPPVLMVSGAQGIGKTTAMRGAQSHFHQNLAVLGLDDFYLTQAERGALGQNVHPLFTTRGPPGTHDLIMLNACIDELSDASTDSETRIPVFDKKTDERALEEGWTVFNGRPVAIIVEGWMIGALPNFESARSTPLNVIEERDDAGIWRGYQEERLASDYAALWNRADGFFHMCAPSFETVLNWRVQQEETTLGLSKGTLPEDRRRWVETFILHYERLTRRMLAGGRRAGLTVHVDAQRQIRPEIPAKVSSMSNLLVFSDLDGTLLDHVDYSFEAAQPALNALKGQGAKLILASSKTADEIEDLRSKMGFSHCPAIVENGGGILPPNGEASARSDDSVYLELLTRLGACPRICDVLTRGLVIGLWPKWLSVPV